MTTYAKYADMYKLRLARSSDARVSEPPVKLTPLYYLVSWVITLFLQTVATCPKDCQLSPWLIKTSLLPVCLLAPQLEARDQLPDWGRNCKVPNCQLKWRWPLIEALTWLSWRCSSNEWPKRASLHSASRIRLKRCRGRRMARRRRSETWVVWSSFFKATQKL